ncbi:hypothetical protein SOVF_094020 [Spinacia oleracea]|uniref:No apical meristem-associated C-terminal domain-containing protein n=1 Tax=Spinacia oleracea TaxID=3562 RepID=A0A9R0HQV6_SPIOL|nr:uncharacterized protein LOC110775020 [Spinacia oleracea]KNA15804.1 hypothetical protein SOVF_094020 [Spinacia oleracea]
MEHCTDIVVGTDQKAAVVWRKVKQSYDAARKSRPMELTKAWNVRMIESRWRRLGRDVMAFLAHYEEAKRMDKSGMQVDDLKQLAHTLYCNSNKSNFRYETSWKMLSKYKKWEERVQWGMSKEDRIRLNQISEPDSSGSEKRVRAEDEDVTVVAGGSYMSGRTPRPDGVKKTKANLRKGKEKEVADEVAMAVSESLMINSRVRDNNMDYKKNKLEFDRLKEDRREKQLELEQRNFVHRQENIRMDLMKSKFDTLTALCNKAELTPHEEKFKDHLMMELYGSTP